MGARQRRTDALKLRRAVRHASAGPNPLLPPDHTIVVAVSGGPDSMALLHALAQEAERARLKLWVAHLNHLLRGLEATADATLVRKSAETLGLPYTFGIYDVAAIHRREGGSLEAVARRVRYRFLARVALKVGADRVAVGHTADDQAETVLLRLLRGTGVTGLAGMAPDAPLPFAPNGSNLRVVRPLLGVTRAQVEAYCAEQGLQPRYDSSNDAPEYTRNRVRHEVLPLLRTINPSVSDALNRLAAHARSDDDLLTTLTDAAWPNVVVAENKGLVELSATALKAQHPAMQTRLVRRALLLARGSNQDSDTNETDAIIGLLAGSGTVSVQLAGGLVAQRSYDRLLLTLAHDPDIEEQCGHALGGPVELQVPGEAVLPGWHITARLVPAGMDVPDDVFQARLDPVAVGERLTVRAWSPGDRIQPLGMTGHRKLQDVFVDAKVPAPCRDRIPVIAGPQGIVWVAGHVIGHPYRVRPETGNTVVWLTAERRKQASG